MTQREVKIMLKKVEEVKALFVFGQRVVPFLEELVLFVQETTPVLQEMNSSIEETSKKMPYAVEKLDQVNETTEQATSGMLDGIDRILADIDDITSGIDELEEQLKNRLDRDREMILKLASSMDGEEETRAAEVEKELKILSEQTLKKSPIPRIREKIETVQGEAFDLINALQVQDITSQQIMAANHLIESIQGKLSELLTKFSGIEVQEIERKDRAFDPNAVYQDRQDLQKEIDEAFKQQKEAEDQKQDDGEPLPVTEVSTEETEKLQQPVSEEEPPPDDGENKTPVSQEEIDALLNQMK